MTLQSILKYEFVHFLLPILLQDLLVQYSKKKVSFHEEMTRRKILNSPPVPLLTKAPAIINQDLDLMQKVQEELRLKDGLIRSSTEANPNNRNVIPDVVLFEDHPISISLPDKGAPIEYREARLGKSLSNEGFPFGEIFQAFIEGQEITLHRIRLEGAFYHSNQGRKKIQAFCKKVVDMQHGIPYSPINCRPIGVTLKAIDERTTDIWVASEAKSDTSLLSEILKCSGTFSPSKSLAIVESVLHGLLDLHSSGFAHQGILPSIIIEFLDLCLNNIVISVDTCRIRLVNIGFSRMLKDLYAIHPFSPNMLDTSNEEELWRPPEIILKSGQAGKKADVWNCAIVLAQLMFGASVKSEFESASGFLSSLHNLRLPIKEMFILMLDR